MQPISFDGVRIISYSDQRAPVSGGYILTSGNVFLEFDRSPRNYYRHGWQSWSLAAWHPAGLSPPIQKPAILQPMQTDPVYVAHPAPNGSWLGAVEFEGGKIALLGALGVDAHVALHGEQLHGWYETGSGEWFLGYGEECDVFEGYARLLGERLGRAGGTPAPRVWCSWYSLYTGISEDLLARVFERLDGYPFDVLQVDDGWQISIGDWRPNEKFSSGMEALAGKIRAKGRTPGLWLAPLLVVPTSALFREHPDWLLRDAEGKLVPAGFNWGEPLYALDTTHPGARDWLVALMEQVQDWGFDYLKLDFLYAGALPGKRYQDMPREAAYRQGLQILREAMGADAYFVACGAPILPSIGLCDALRVGPDVAGEWQSHRDATLLYNLTTPGTRNAIRTTLNRLWLKPLVVTDPDVAYFSSAHNSLNVEQKSLLQDLALICAFKATSDLPQWLSEEEKNELHAFLHAKPDIERTGRYTFRLNGREVNFGRVTALPDPPGGLDLLKRWILSWIGNRPWALKLFHAQEKRALQNKLNHLN